MREKKGALRGRKRSLGAPGRSPAEGVLSSTLSGARDVIAARAEVRGIDPEKQNPDRHRPIGVL
jgi:hypothetical protein